MFQHFLPTSRASFIVLRLIVAKGLLFFLFVLLLLVLPTRSEEYSAFAKGLSTDRLTVKRGVTFTYKVETNSTAKAFVAFGLPKGLTLNSSTGIISGNVTRAGIYRIDLAASSDGKTYGRGQLILTVAGPAPATSSPVQTAIASHSAKPGVALNLPAQAALTAGGLSPYVSTLVGNNGSGDVDGPAPLAQLAYPAAVAYDQAGNLYVADTGNSAIRKISAAGVVTTLAGPTNQGAIITTGSADGTGTTARFNFPSGVAVDATGNVYVSDTRNETIRKVTPQGVVTTLAGTAGLTGRLDSVTGSQALFNSPSELAVDGSGNVYVEDLGNQEVRKVTPGGQVTTLSSGSGFIINPTNPVTSTSNFFAQDSSGNFYLYDLTQNHIIKFNTQGQVSTTYTPQFPGNAGGSVLQVQALAVDSTGQLYYATDYAFYQLGSSQDALLAGNENVNEFSSSNDGYAANATFSYISGLASHGQGTFCLIDSGALRLYQPSATVAPAFTGTTATTGRQGEPFTYISTWSGTPIVDYGATGLPIGLTFNAENGLIAGTPSAPGTYSIALSAVNGTGTTQANLSLNILPGLPRLINMTNLTQGATLGQFYSFTPPTLYGPTGFAATNLPPGLLLNPMTGVISGTPTLLGVWSTTITLSNTQGSSTGSLNFTVYPSGVLANNYYFTPFASGSGPLAVDSSGNVYAVDASGEKVNEIDASGFLGNFGIGGADYNFGYYITDLAIDASGTVSVTGSSTSYDNDGNPLSWITQVTSSGVATTVTTFPDASELSVDAAKNLYFVAMPDYFSANLYQLTPAGSINALSDLPAQEVLGLVGDGKGDYFYTDYAANSVNAVTPPNSPMVLAGNSDYGTPGNQDGEGSAAQFNSPRGIARDTKGNLFVADFGNNTIRKVTLDGRVVTIGGLAGVSGSISGPGNQARFNGPENVAVDAHGNLFVTDSSGIVWKGTPPIGPPPVISTPTTIYGALGTPFSLQVQASNGPILYTATGLPPGYSIDQTTGLISGTSTTPGSYSVAVAVGNATGTTTQTLNFSIQAVIPPIVTNSTTLAEGTGVPFSLAITASNGATSYSASVLYQKLSGTIIGTPGSYQNLGTTTAKAFDGDPTTYFDGPSATGNWVGLDLGTSPAAVAQVKYLCRPSFASRMVGGSFQTSSTPDFSSGVATLATIKTAPTNGVQVTLPITGAAAQRYVRYLSPANSYGDIAELEFDSAPGSTLPSGLSLNPTTGVLSGTLKTATVYTLQLGATNAGGTGTANLVLTVTPASLAWSGTTNSNWDLSAPNWLSGTTTASYLDGDNVSFTDAGLGGVIALNSPLSPGSVAVNNSVQNYSLSGTGSLTGPMTLTKSGTSSLTLSTTNSYTGATMLQGGTLVLAGGNAIAGTLAGPAVSSLVVSAGTLQLQGTPANTTTNNGVATSSALTASSTPSFVSLGSATVQLRSDANVTFNGFDAMSGVNGTTLNFDVGSLTTAGSNNTLSIASAGFPTGPETINVTGSQGDQLSISGVVSTTTGTKPIFLLNPTTANLTLGGYTSKVAGSVLALNGAGANNVVTGAITGGSLVSVLINAPEGNSGTTSTWSLNGANTYTGATTVSAGTLLINGSITSPVTVASGAALGGSGTIKGNVTIASGGTLDLGVVAGAVKGLAIQGNLALSGTINVTPAAGTGPIAFGSYPIFTYTGTLTGMPTFVWNGGATNETAYFSTSTPGTISAVIAPPIPAITSSGSASGATGAPFTYQIVASNNPTSYTAPGLPSGLTLNATTGLISGTPTSPGTYAIPLTAVNTGGTGYATLTFSFLIPSVTTPRPMATGGYVFSAALRADGSVWTWGDNTTGQLGQGTSGGTSSVATQIPNLTSVRLACAYGHTLALAADGTVWGWGDNLTSDLGDGSTVQQNSPEHIAGLSNIVALSCGQYFSAALKNDGTVWVFGSSSNGQLGLGNTATQATPVPLTGLTGVVAIAAGQNHLLLLKGDGTVWSCGLNSSGQLGLGSTVQQLSPGQIPNLSGMTAIAASDSYSLALKNDQSVWAWGSNSNGQLGDGTMVNESSPKQVSGITGTAIAADSNSPLVLQSNGTLLAWGKNGQGLVGNGQEQVNQLTPTLVTGLSSIVSITGSGLAGRAVDAHGIIWTWGNDFQGQCGDGQSIFRYSPVQVSNFTGAVSLAGGSTHAAVVKTDGSLWMWGDDTFSDLGDASLVSKPVPQMVTGLSTTARAVALGGSHTLALLSDQTVWSWGNNSSGQLGLGTNVNQGTPVQVLTGVSALGAGASHSLAVMRGEVLTWGLNSNGQLGNGSTTSLSTPAAIAGLSNIVAVAGGSSHSLALDANGKVYAWGLNSSGQVGDNTTTQRTSPVPIIGFGGPVTAIVAGSNFNLALKSDQTVWAWGQNNYGQIGNGNTANQMTPVQVPGLSGITALAAGASHAVALKNDGTVWTWGYNNDGQLGNGTYTSSSTPTQVPGVTGVIAIAAETSSTVAVKQDGTLCSWGFSNNGELAIEIKTAHSIPAPVNGLNLLTASPTLALISPALNSTDAIGHLIPLTVNAATPSGSIAKVNYYNEGVLIASSTTAPFSASFTPTTSGSFDITAVAINSGGQYSARTATATVHVAPPAIPTITSATAFTISAGSPFTYTITATNNPSFYSVAGLGSGLTFDSHLGIISGTPTGSATISMSLGASNLGGTGRGTLTLTILSPPSVTSSKVVVGTTTAPFFYAITASGNPTSYSVTGLPAGLSLNQVSGVISGTPTIFGTTIVNVAAANSTGTGSSPITITVYPTALTDSDGNGLADAWEQQYFGKLGNVASQIDPNGLTTLESFEYGLNPISQGKIAPWSLQLSSHPWYYADLGVVGVAGSSGYSAQTYSVNGAGTGIGSGADSGHFLYQPIAGNVEMIAHVSSIQNTGPYATAGLMLRDSTSSSAVSAYVAVSPSNGLTFTVRSATGAISNQYLGQSVTAPVWLRLVRSATTLSESGTALAGYSTLAGYYSSDGYTWTLIGTQIIQMADSSLLGMAVSSTTPITTATGLFDHVNSMIYVPQRSANLVGWYRADVGVIQNAGKVSVWQDQSGNGSDMSQVNATNQPSCIGNSLNSLPSLQFSSASKTSMLATNPAVLNPSQFTVIAVARRTSGSSLGTIATQNSGSNYPYFIGFNTTQPFLELNAGPGAAGTLASSTYGIIEGVYAPSGGGENLFVNGTQTTTAYSATLPTNSTPLSIGNAGQTSYFLDGNIAELLIYNSALSTTQRQQVEAYLYQKYGIGNQPISPSALKSIAASPTYSEGSGVYSGAQSVTIISGNAGGTIYYTTDGSNPTINSAIYSGPITISSTTELQAVETSPGFQTSPVASSKYIIDKTIAFTRNGLVGWYRADVGVQQTGGKVSQWIDQSGNGNNAVQTSAAQQPTLISNAINNQPALQFSSSNLAQLAITGNSARNPQQFTVIAVSKQTTVSRYASILSQDDGQSYPYFLSYYNSFPFFALNASAGSPALSLGGGGLASGSYGSLEAIYDGNVASFYVNGTLTQSANYKAVITGNTSPLTIGGVPGDSSYPLDGQIAELLIFNTALSNQQRQQVEGYLYQRYGIGTQPVSTIPTLSVAPGTYGAAQAVTVTPSNPGDALYYTVDGSTPTTKSTLYTMPINISATSQLRVIDVEQNFAASPVLQATYTIDPTSAFTRNGLVGWYRADVGVQQTGGKVSQWIDQSGNGNNAVQTYAAQQPTLVSNVINNQPALQFNSSSLAQLAITGNSARNPQQFTVIAVSKQTATSRYASILSQDDGQSYPYFLSYYNSFPFFALNASAGSPALSLGGGGLASGSYGSLEAIYDGNVASFYVNGTLTQSANYKAVITGNTSPLTIGGVPGDSSYPLDGQIAELLIFNTALSNQQRQQVEGYLYQRYGIGTQPVSTIPTLSVAPGTYGAAQAVTVTPSNPGDALYYTVDGSTPTTKSTLYTMPINISATSQLRVIDVEQNFAASSVLQATYTIDPTSAFTRNGLVGWYRADVGVQQTGGKVSQWIDQSGNGNNAVQTSAAQQPTLVSNVINNQPALQFNSSSLAQLAITGNSARNPQQFTVIAVSKQTTVSRYASILSQDDGQSYPYFLSYYNSFPFFALNASAGSPALSLGGGGLASGSYGSLEAIYDGNVASFYVNGTLTQSANYKAVITGNTSPLTIGGVPGDSSYPLDGQIAELLIFNTALSNQQRQQVEGYLYQRYGIGTQPVSTIPTLSVAPGTYGAAQAVTVTPSNPGDALYYTVDGSTPTTKSTLYTMPINISATSQLRVIDVEQNFAASPVLQATYTIDPAIAFTRNGLVGWYRADVGVQQTGGKVSVWQDQSGNGSDMNQVSGANQPLIISSSLNGLPTLQFSSASKTSMTATNSAVLNPSQVTIFAVARRTSGSSLGTIATQNNGSNYPYFFGFKTNQPFFELNAGPSIAGTLASSAYGVLEGIYTPSSGGENLYVNGTQTTNAYSTALSSNTTPLSIGNADGNYYFLDGNIAELLIYNSVLSDQDRQSVETYLSYKYGISLVSSQTPQFSTPAGALLAPAEISLNVPTGQVLYYTTDGTTPTNGSTPYTGPIYVDYTTTIKVQAYLSGTVVGGVLSATYTLNAAQFPGPGTSNVSAPIINLQLPTNAILE